MKRKLLIVLCLTAVLIGVAVATVLGSGASHTEFKAGYGMGEITPDYVIKDVAISSSAAQAAAGVSDRGTVQLKIVEDRLIFGSYGTSEARMGQNYLDANSYDASGNQIKKLTGASAKSYFTYENGQEVTYQFVDSDLYATCIALQNGDEAPLLLLSLDLSGVSEALTADIRSRVCEHVKQETGIQLDPERIMVTATHTHSAPNVESKKESNVRWLEDRFYWGVLQAALAAVQDLAEADIEVGTVVSNDQSHNYNGSNIHELLQYMNAVRHYKYLIYQCNICGVSYTGDNYADGYREMVFCPGCGRFGTRKLVTRYYGDSFYTRAEGIAAPYYMQMPVKEAYQDLHLVKFERDGYDITRKDIVLINWRVHPHRTGGEEKAVFSSDVIGALRDALSGVRGQDGSYTGIGDSEKACLVSYYQGAAGNINEVSHDRAGNAYNNSFGTSCPEGMEQGEYGENYYGDNQSERYTGDYYSQGYALAQISRFGLESCMDNSVAEGPVESIHSNFTSDGAELSVQILQLQEAGYTDEEYVLYDMLYDIGKEMQKVWGERYDTGKYATIQDCRKALLEKDYTGTFNGIYQANKIVSLLEPYLTNGEFSESSYENYCSDKRYKTQELNGIVIGDEIAIVTAPHEMFDNSSLQLEGEQERFDLKKILTFGYSNGANGYLPNREAWMYSTVDAMGNPVTYSPYEANVCNYGIGTAEAIVNSWRAMLGDLTAQHSSTHTRHCACQGSSRYTHNTGHVCSFEDWEPVDASTTVLDDGRKYYLTADTQVATLQVQGNAMLCLNGYTLKVKSGTLNVDAGDVLSISDCAEAETGVMENLSATDRLFYVYEGGTLLLYGGTFSGNSTHRVLLSKGNVFLFGGVIRDGKTTMGANSGNVTVNAGEFWQYGGVIENGQTNCKPWENDTLSNLNGTRGAGGNLYLDGGVYYQYAGQIRNGSAALSGGNVAISGGTFYQYGGVISGGQAVPEEAGLSRNPAGTGGNVYVGAGQFHQYGVVTDGVAARMGGNIYAGRHTAGGGSAIVYLYEGGVLTGGRVTGNAVKVAEFSASVDPAFAISDIAAGGNLACSTATAWLYGGVLEKGQAGYGGNLYLQNSTGRVACAVENGQATAQGNNIYFNGESHVLNLGGARILQTDGQAQENVYVENAESVKLIDNCQILGGVYAVEVKHVSDEDAGGVWLNHAPVLSGQLADIRLGADSMLCVYAYFAHESYGGDNDNRIRIAGVDENADMKFARTASSGITLEDIQDCFEGWRGECYQEGTIRKLVEDPSDFMKQWLVLTPCSATLDQGTEKTHSMQGAVDAAAQSGSTVKLLQDLDMGDTALRFYPAQAATLVIDLNGYDLTAEFDVAQGASVACIDTSLVYYEDSQEHGKLYTQSPVEAQIRHSDGVKTRRFLRISEAANAEGVPGYSFHRVYMNMSKLSVNPRSGNVSVYGAFLADRQVTDVLCAEGNGYGFRVSLMLDGNTVKEPVFVQAGKRIQAGPYQELSSLNPYTGKKTVVENVLATEALQGYSVQERAQMQICIETAVKIGDEMILPGNQVVITFEEMLAKMNADWQNANRQLKQALLDMYGAYQDVMSSWDESIIGQVRSAYETANRT